MQAQTDHGTDPVAAEPTLETLACEMDRAMAESDWVRFCRLERSRHQILLQIRAPGGPAPLPAGRLNELLGENRRWMTALAAQRDRVRAEIERVRANRNTHHCLSRAYRRPSSASLRITRRG